jgi:hypothetical protein
VKVSIKATRAAARDDRSWRAERGSGGCGFVAHAIAENEVAAPFHEKGLPRATPSEHSPIRTTNEIAAEPRLAPVSRGTSGTVTAN